MNQVLITAGAVLLGALAGALGPRWAVALMSLAGFASMVIMYFAMPRARAVK
jgi:hypothetical protein